MRRPYGHFGGPGSGRRICLYPRLADITAGVVIRGSTKIVGIFGDPVAHSRSPAMHNAAFAHLGVDYIYVPLQVKPDDLRAAVVAIRALNLAGVNVTVPHKERILPLLDSVSEAATRAGAVNTVINRAGHLHGENTDGIGFVRALRDRGVTPRGLRIVVVGAGGAARGVIAALVGSGARRVVIANRTFSRARRLARLFGGRETAINVLPLDALTAESTLADADLVVNATAIGLHGERFPDLAYAASRSTCLFYDLLYGADTDFLRSARRHRRPTLDGATMLLHQGAAAFSLWTGRRPPLSVMAKALGLRVQNKIDKPKRRR
ncbi:MAG TPA: shikimate dehydrogenase [Candidatus Binatia bacterium]|nr:shikimate dehydrogenase [Candidatus Binatia bacterium]